MPKTTPANPSPLFRRRRTLACAALALGAMLPASPAAETTLLQQASQALAESIPQVAVQKLRTFLATPALTPADRDEAMRKLGEALLATGQNNEALAAIQPLVNARDSAALLLRAHILAASGRWLEALPIYHALAAAPDSPISARIGEAEALHATGQTAKAIAALEAVGASSAPAQLRLASLHVDAGQTEKARKLLANIRTTRPEDVKWKRFLEGRLLLLEGHAAPALVTFEEVLRDPKHLSDNLLADATIGVADARVILNGYEAADSVVETFIWRHPGSAHLERMFEKLDDIYAHEDDPPESELQKWAVKPPARRAALGRYYVARMQVRSKRFDKAVASMGYFIESYPNHALLPRVQEMLADVFLTRRDFPAAIRALEAAERATWDEEGRLAVELRRGLAHYQAGEFLLAANLFDTVAKRAPELRETALYNGALAALNQRNFDRFLELYREITAEFASSPLRSELILEQGLLQARLGDARAKETLLLFLNHFPQHERTAEARLALAELALNAGEVSTANEFRLAVNDSTPTREIDDQTQYLAIFLADAKTPRRDEEVIELATKFIRERAKSPLLAEVRMKLGQVYFRKDDFANAETQFATLARETPESPYAETALYLAGQAAAKSINTGAIDRALDLFDQVAKRDGAMKLYARQQQAVIQSRTGKENEAIALYDIILGSQPPPDAELRFAALAGKGDNFLALGRKDPKQFEAAVGAFDQLAKSPEVTPAWRNQALYKKAKALESLSRTAEALATFYDVLDQTTKDGREFLWFYKAGFDAARIFESQEQWRPAIGVYEKMTKLEGPRTAEAKARLKQLRLEHFIWE